MWLLVPIPSELLGYERRGRNACPHEVPSQAGETEHTALWSSVAGVHVSRDQAVPRGACQKFTPDESSLLPSCYLCVFLCQGLEMFLCRQNTNQGNLPRLWHWWLACSTALTPCAQASCPPEEPGVLSTLQKAGSGCWEQRCELECDCCLPLRPFVVSVTATGTPSCRTPACEATAPTWAATRWALVSVAAWA